MDVPIGRAVVALLTLGLMGAWAADALQSTPAPHPPPSAGPVRSVGDVSDRAVFHEPLSISAVRAFPDGEVLVAAEARSGTTRRSHVLASADNGATFADVTPTAWALHPHSSSTTWSRGMLAGHSRAAAVALSASPDLVDRLVLLSPAGLVGVRVSPQVLRATLPWLVRPSEQTAARLLQVMTSPGRELPHELVTWLATVSRETRTAGAPGPLPPAVIDRWRLQDVEVVWTVDPRAVRHASRIAAALADEYRPELRTTELPLLADEPPTASADLRRASDLLTRTMGYLDAGH